MCRFVLQIYITFNTPKVRNVMHDFLMENLETNKTNFLYKLGPLGLLVISYLEKLDIRDCNNFPQIFV